MSDLNNIPGTPRYNGPHSGIDAVAEHVYYTADTYSETELLGSRIPTPVDGRVDWYDWRGLGATQDVIAFAKALGMPPLAIEDALDMRQRPKYEERAGSFFLVLPHLSLDADGKLVREQISVFWTDQIVLSLQEFPDDVFHGVRLRVRESLGRVRTRGTTYLAYALADCLLDEYSALINHLEDQCDRLEDDILSQDHHDDAKLRIHELKKLVNKLRRSLVALREAVGRWHKSDHTMREPNIDAFLRDLSDNVVRDHELLEGYGTRTNDLYSLYSSELAVETNSVVQVLTVVSAIFIPLTFLAGIYGMNFANIPELQYQYGYFILLGVMVFVALVLLLIFRKRGWL